MRLIRFALISSTLAVAACGGGGQSPDEGRDEQPPVPPDPTVDADSIHYNDVPVHDPSIFRTDDGTFYVVGSHLAMASSKDLVTWEQTAPGVDLEAPDFASNPLFSNYEIEVSEGIEWTGGHAGSWAADIIQLSDGNYYFYYNHCANPATGDCDMPRSYLGVAVAEDILGPYEDRGIFLRSGQSESEIAEGYGVGDVTAYDPTVHPNTIDPDVFYDKDGKLWMIYGSYSGGIFILEMDEATGKPLPDQGYGKRLAGGSHSAIEGTYMLYSPESDYYYLFASFGGYVSTDGYNIRIARSRNPDGPFLDAEGKDMADARGNWDSIEPYGVKLMGGFNFESHVGDPTPGHGYLAPGHNSAWYDAETGTHFLITHTRFPNRGEQHAIRVHELFVNADGWLVASPQRYAPIEGENRVDALDIVGDYKFINHEKDINRQAKQSLPIRLTQNREITGAVTGSYEMYEDEPNRITLTLDGLGVYEGIARWQWDAAAERLTPAFTALGSDGSSVWGVQQPHLSNGEVLQAVVNALVYPATFKSEQLYLPTTGTRGTSISWTTDNRDVITAEGRVLRPNVGESDQVVGLTATAVRDGEEEYKTLYISVPARQPLNRVAQFDFEGDLSEALGNFDAGMATGDRVHATGGTVGYATGHENQALVLDGSSGVKLPDSLITNYNYTVAFWINPTTTTLNTPAFFGAVNERTPEGSSTPSSNSWISFLPHGWDGNTMLWSGSEVWIDATTGERIPTGQWSHMAVAVDNGLVKVFLNGEEKYAGGNLPDFFTGAEGKFALGVNYWDTPLHGLIDELKIYDAALSGGELLALDVEKWASAELLTSAVDLLDPGDLSAVQDDIQLPVTGPYASAVSWTSSDPSVIRVEHGKAVVTRPPEGQADAEVTLTATVTLDGDAATRDFVARVRALGPPQPLAAFRFDDSLEDSTGNFGSGTPTGDRLDNAGGTPNYTAGISGSALSLDGTTGVALPDNLITGSTYTVAMWLNPAALTQFAPAFFGATTDSSWISVVPHGPGEGNTMLWSGTAWYDGDTGTRIPAGSWTHFVAVNNQGALTLYLNGEEVFSGTNFPDVFAAGGTSRFGVGVNYWDSAYQGLIDELRIFDVPASATHVKTWYDTSAPEG